MGVMRGLLGLQHQDDVVKACLPLPKPDIKVDWVEYSRAHIELSKLLHGLFVNPQYNGCRNPNKTFWIKKLLTGSADEYMLDIKNPAIGVIKKQSVQDYYLEKYDLELEYPHMRLVEMYDGNVVYPAGLLEVKGLQRYNKKLTVAMTSQMIKYTAQKPNERREHIDTCKDLFGHEGDPNLKLYGMEISNRMIKTKARLLPSPEIQFGNAKHNPGMNGRWDLRGKKFYKPNVKPLTCWVIGYLPVDRDVWDSQLISNWQDNFARAYKQHGGIIQGRVVSLNNG